MAYTTSGDDENTTEPIEGDPDHAVAQQAQQEAGKDPDEDAEHSPDEVGGFLDAVFDCGSEHPR